MYISPKKSFTFITLVFFLFTTLSSPVLAQSAVFSASNKSNNTSDRIPITYVTEHQVEWIIEAASRQGYQIKEGTWQLLAELQQQSNQDQAIKHDKVEDCQPAKKNNKDKEQKADKKKLNECVEETQQQKLNQLVPPVPTEEPIPPQPVPPPVAQPQVQTNVGIYADVSYGSGRGGHSDAGKVFFIVAGIMVIAAFIVYAGKYISDLASGKDYDVWWEFIFTNTNLSTRSGQHGYLNGLKIATGYISSDLIQIALVGEIGKTDIELVLDDNSVNPMPLDFSASYWLLGATARLHLTDKLINASYLYLEFMGGKTDHGSTDTIGMARLGASFGISDNFRLGASLGAFYLGLDEDQGFANDGDNYWSTFGIELGARF